MGLELSKIFVSKTKEWQIVEQEVNTALEKQRQHFRPKSVQELADSTGFSKKEVQLLYRSFKENCPNGIVNRETFQEIYSEFFYFGDAREYARLVFGTFDEDGNGEINFQEFVQGLSSLLHGTLEEKLKWIFRLYDYERRGFITERNLYHVVGSVYDMMGTLSKPPITEDAILKHAHFIFQRMDFNHDGRINEEEFVAFCLKDENICKNLVLLHSVLKSQFQSSSSDQNVHYTVKGLKISSC